MELIPVYICYNPLEAQNAKAILASEDLEPVMHDLRSSAFPLHGDSMSRITIEVLATNLDKARQVLRAAKDNGELQGEGEVA